MAGGGDAQGGRGDAPASCASPLDTPLPIGSAQVYPPLNLHQISLALYGNHRDKSLQRFAYSLEHRLLILLYWGGNRITSFIICPFLTPLLSRYRLPLKVVTNEK
jgi:hypothetical protein